MSEVPTAPPLLFLVRYSEIGLKGDNRGIFEDALVRNLRERLHAPPLGAKAFVTRRHGRVSVLIEPPEGASLEGLAAQVLSRISDTPGVRSVSRGRTVPATPSLEELKAAAVDAARVALARRSPRPRTFRIRSTRSDKRFPVPSMQVDAALGAAVAAALPELSVELETPDLEIGVEVGREEAFVHADATDGPGGLPVGSSGKVVLLLSGGIDSPVAGFLLQKRGCALTTVYCHAFPYVGDAAREKTIDLARLLARRQSVLSHHVVPIADAQLALKAAARPELLLVLYRRLMLRIAERVARAVGASAIATGETIGQVASQTLGNMRAIEAATPSFPVLRPLATYDKEETIALARRLGCYETSIRKAEDACQLFLPKRPSTKVPWLIAEAAEQKVDASALADAAYEKQEIVRFVGGATVAQESKNQLPS